MNELGDVTLVCFPSCQDMMEFLKEFEEFWVNENDYDYHFHDDDFVYFIRIITGESISIWKTTRE